MYKKLSLLCILSFVVLSKPTFAEGKYYPFYTFGNLWGIGEPYSTDAEDSLPLKKTLDSLNIQLPFDSSGMIQDDVRERLEEQKKQYSEIIDIDRYKFFLLREPKLLLKAWLGKEKVSVKIFTTKGIFYTKLNKVYVQALDPCVESIVILGVQAGKKWGQYGIPLFGSIVENTSFTEGFVKYSKKLKKIKNGYKIDENEITGNLILTHSRNKIPDGSFDCVYEDIYEWEENVEFLKSDGGKISAKYLCLDKGKESRIEPIVEGDKLIVPICIGIDSNYYNNYRKVLEFKGDSFVEIINSRFDYAGISCD